MKVNHPIIIGAIVAVSVGVAIFTKEWIDEKQLEEEFVGATFDKSLVAEDADGGSNLMEVLEELDDGSEMLDEDARARSAQVAEIDSGERGGRAAAPEVEELEDEDEDRSDEDDKGRAEKGESEISDIARASLVAAKILSDQRFLDPFGMAMDPANRAEIATLADTYEETEDSAPVLNNSALKNALGRLPITGIYPGRQVVVVGPRAFERGHEVGLKVEGITLRLRFEGIYNRMVYFRDMETNEITSVEFNPLPPEFEPIRPGSRQESPNGIHAMNSLFIAN